MNALFCALDKKEFHKISGFSNAYEIWKKLDVVYEGTIKSKSLKSVDILGNTNC